MAEWGCRPDLVGLLCRRVCLLEASAGVPSLTFYLQCIASTETLVFASLHFATLPDNTLRFGIVHLKNCIWPLAA